MFVALGYVLVYTEKQNLIYLNWTVHNSSLWGFPIFFPLKKNFFLLKKFFLLALVLALAVAHRSRNTWNGSGGGGGGGGGGSISPQVLLKNAFIINHLLFGNTNVCCYNEVFLL